MKVKVNLKNAYAPSENIVARDIQGELIIVPITSGIGDFEDEIFTLNKTGRLIWDRMDGKKSLKDIARELAAEFKSSEEEITKDVFGLAEELLKRKMIVEAA